MYLRSFSGQRHRHQNSSAHQSKSTQTLEDDIQSAALVSHMTTMTDSELMHKLTATT